MWIPERVAGALFSSFRLYDGGIFPFLSMCFLFMDSPLCYSVAVYFRYSKLIDIFYRLFFLYFSNL